jgi:seryl-tRNA synthetase
MLDIKFIRENPDLVRKGLLNKNSKEEPGISSNSTIEKSRTGHNSNLR